MNHFVKYISIFILLISIFIYYCGCIAPINKRKISISGHVIDKNDKSPIEHATVELLRMEWTSGKILEDTNTDQHGYYKLIYKFEGHCGDGTFKFEAKAENYNPVSYTINDSIYVTCEEEMQIINFELEKIKKY